MSVIKNGNRVSHDGSDQTADEEKPFPMICDRISNLYS
jgi:hypothetical protein